MSRGFYSFFIRFRMFSAVADDDSFTKTLSQRLGSTLRISSASSGGAPGSPLRDVFSETMITPRQGRPMISSALLMVWSFLAHVPQFLGRVRWLSKLMSSLRSDNIDSITEADIDHYSSVNVPDLDAIQGARPLIICPRPCCGRCGKSEGDCTL